MKDVKLLRRADLMGMILLGDNKNEDNKKIVIAKILNICKQGNINKLALVSSDEEIIKSSFATEIIEKLKKDNIDITVNADIMKNADKIEKVLDASGIVLIEGVGKSLLDKVNDEAEFIEDYNLNLLGVVNCEA